MTSSLDAINNSWNSGIYPEKFNSAILLPILKPGKDASIVGSYRPISLLSCLEKVIEKLVFRRLYMLMENKNYLQFFQCGFRAKHSCLDAQIYLENYIQVSLRKQKYF